MKQPQSWPFFLVTRHSLSTTPRAVAPVKRRVAAVRAKQEFPRVANLTRRRPPPKGH